MITTEKTFTSSGTACTKRKAYLNGYRRIFYRRTSMPGWAVFPLMRIFVVGFIALHKARGLFERLEENIL
jgi:hypothetical protein